MNQHDPTFDRDAQERMEALHSPDERHDAPPDDVNWQDWYAGLALCDYFELPPVLDVDMSPQERARHVERQRQINDLCRRGEKAVGK